MPQLRPDPVLISVAEAADLLGVHVRTIHRWVADGKLPVAHRMSGKTGAILVDKAKVEALREQASA